MSHWRAYVTEAMLYSIAVAKGLIKKNPRKVSEAVTQPRKRTKDGRLEETADGYRVCCSHAMLLLHSVLHSVSLNKNRLIGTATFYQLTQNIGATHEVCCSICGGEVSGFWTMMHDDARRGDSQGW